MAGCGHGRGVGVVGPWVWLRDGCGRGVVMPAIQGLQAPLLTGHPCRLQSSVEVGPGQQASQDRDS